MTTALHTTRDQGSQGRLSRRPIVEVMTAPAPIIADNVPLVEAIATMVRLGVGHIVLLSESR